MLEKKYNHKIVEDGRYKSWLDKGYFKSGDKSKDPFCIVIPPPNVTGKLHIGHAWDTTLQDIIVRFKRMQGFDTLWLPGMDHAAIATETKVVNRLKDKGINKYDCGREEFLKECWKWTDEHKELIRDQWAKLGLSVDYSKERFTLDEGLNKAVTKVFIDFYNQGLIYRGERIINWDPKAKTALSNEEVIYKDVEGAFYHIKYFIEGSSDYLEIATTRPETLFGDTAVAVNPEDSRYKDLIGKNVILPIIDKKIKIVADEHADPEFGTGVVKITPAHDPNDFEVGNRHGLQRVVCINEDGTMNSNAGVFEGLDRFECRKQLVKKLEEEDLLIKVEKMTHSVGHSERSGVIVEPYLSKQWFVKMQPLSEKVLRNQKAEDKVNFYPKRFEKTLEHWMEISYDWCISRQLWWGHRIPAWYKDGEVCVGEECPGEGWEQDKDVLDTWFSSALWPFSTLGWPNKTEDFERYYPNNVLVTGFDIIFFWVCRMVFQGLELTDKAPFNDCLIHGLIRDKDGRKMSKSLGNGVDPMDEIDKYGADALRYFLSTSSAAGQDLRYDEEKVKASWNFINKIWNASRFVLMNLESFKEEDKTKENLKEEDKWILNKLNQTIGNVTKLMDNYEFNVVGTELYNFVWNDFCDWYIELSKNSLDSNTTKTVLLEVLESILKLLHPFMPYVTEEIYLMLPIHDESIMLSNYPVFSEKSIPFETLKFDGMLRDIKRIRKIMNENKISKKDLHKISLENTEKKWRYVYITLFKIDEEKIEYKQHDIEVEKVNNNIQFKNNGEVFNGIKSGNIIIEYNTNNKDINTESINKEIEVLKQNIVRREKLLSNDGYVKNAPEIVVEKERKALEEEKERLALLSS